MFFLYVVFVVLVIMGLCVCFFVGGVHGGCVCVCVFFVGGVHGGCVCVFLLVVFMVLDVVMSAALVFMGFLMA